MQGWYILADSIKELLKRFKSSDKKIKILVLLGIIGIVLILLSEVGASVPKREGDEYSYEKYVASLEKETKELVEAIDGAGECRVMLTLKNSKESVYAKNSEENSSEGSYSDSYEYVLYKSSGNEQPVLIKEYFPQVMGVAVVCSGGDSIAIKEDIINCLSSVFDIPSSKISVSKLKQ